MSKASNGASRSLDPVRFAVVGLGHIAQVAVLPAFKHAKHAKLTALVSSDQEKRRELGELYEIPQTYSYEEYEKCLRSDEVDAVYIALPNSLHREYAERAARAGVHVLCEKPLAVTEEECESMILMAREAKVLLMTAYRLHFEAANLKILEYVNAGKIGELRLFNSNFTMQVRENNIRLRADLGGGPLYDIGIYCINAARTLFQQEPVEVFAFAARSADERFKEVPESVSALLRFPQERLAAFVCGFGAADVSNYQIVGTKGWLRADPAYGYVDELAYELQSGETHREKSVSKRDQFAPELEHFAACIRDGKTPEPSGEEGLADVRVICALQRSLESGAPVRLAPRRKTQQPQPEQESHGPPVKKPPLIHVEAPSK